MKTIAIHHFGRSRRTLLRFTAGLLAFASLGLPLAKAQVWVEQGPGPMINGQVEGMSAQSYPDNGAIQRIAVNPTDPNTMLIGAVNGGIWRTTNATAANPSWTPVGDFLSSLAIGSLTYDAANASTMYAGMGRFSALARTGGARAGLFTSTDGGVTWGTVAGNATLASNGVNISATVANGQNILVAADNADNYSWSALGLWRSTNGGASFTHVAGGSTGLPDIFAASVVADPTNSSRYYLAGYNPFAAANNGVWRSDNAGATWTKLSAAAMDAVMNTTTGNIKLSVNNNGTLFAGVVDNGRCAGVFRFTRPESGAVFTNFGIPTTTDGGGNPIVNGIHPGGQGGIHFSLAADPTSDNVVYVGGDRQPLGTEVNNVSAVGANNYSGRLFRSSGAGSWTAITNNQTANGSSPHADSRAMAFDLSGNLIESDDGGLYRRTAPSASTGAWTSLGSSGVPGGLRTAEIHSLAYDNHGGVLIAGTQDTGSVMQTAANGTTWNTLMQGDGGVVAVYDRPGGNSYRYYNYVGLQYFSYRSYNAAGTQVGSAYPTLTINGSGGKTIQQFEPSAFPDDEDSKATAYGPDAEPGVPFYAKYVANKVDAGRLVFGTNSLYETADHGATLECLGGITAGAPTVRFASTVNALAYGGFKGTTGYADVLYSGAGTELRIRPAGGGLNNLPAVDTAFNAAAGSSGFAITDVVEDYTDWDTAFVADSLERVFRTANGGSTWIQMPSNLSSLIGNELETLEYVENGSCRAVFAGGLNGVFWSLDPGTGIFGPWSEFGGGSLPNAKVRDLDYDPYANVLAVGMQGRGAWTISNANFYVVPEPAALALLSMVGLALAASRLALRRNGKK